MEFQDALVIFQMLFGQLFSLKNQSQLSKPALKVLPIT